MPITAGTSYVASYYAPNGRYSQDIGFFNSPYDNAPLHVAQSLPGAPNGLYLYGSDAFPTSSFASTNYWVDPVFTTTAPLITQSATRSPGTTGTNTETTPASSPSGIGVTAVEPTDERRG